MPEKIVCKNCGYVLYEGLDLIPPIEVFKRVNGRCPSCNAPLLQAPADIRYSLHKGESSFPFFRLRKS